MTTTSVKDVGSVMNLGAAGAAQAGRAGNAGFQDVWNTQTGKNAASADKQTVAQNPSKVSKAEGKAKPGDDLRARDTDRSAVRSEKRKASKSEAPEELTGEELEKAAEAVGTAVAELILQITETFGISAEDLQDLMTELDLEPADLLRPADLSNLLLAAGGAEDSLSLLTNEQLYADYQTLVEQGRSVLEEVSENLQLTPEELVQTLDQMRTVTDENPEADAAGSAKELTVTEESVQIEGTLPKEPVIEVTVQAEGPDRADIPQDIRAAKQAASDQKPADVRGQDDEVEQSTGQDAIKQNTEVTDGEKPDTGIAQTQQSAARQETSDSGASAGRHEGRREHSGRETAEGNLVLQTIRNEQFQPQAEQVQETARAWDVDTQDLMRQIMDYMRIQVRPGVSNLEMQLHPASLGTLQVQIASKGGVLTANFITQNEAVKAALESQMVQLKESFEQQGVRVEAIEVTVQTHQFEENLEQGRGRQPEGSAERRGRTRRINLNELSDPDIAAGLEEAEQIAAEMMAADGNTVDYTA